MIGVNKNIKQDTLTISDWDVNTPGYSTFYGWSKNSTSYSYNGNGQGGWTFASLTDAEYNNLLVATSLVTLPNGTFPFLNDIICPIITTDAGGNVTLTVNSNALCKCRLGTDRFSLAQLKANYTANAGKLSVAETTVPTDKNKITHLVYVVGKEGTVAGSMTIDPTKFAAFTVGTMGSGAEIILTDNTIAPGKQFLFGDTQDTSFSITFTTALNVVQ